MFLLGIAESARRMRTHLKKKISTRTLYRHLDEYETRRVMIPQTRIVWDNETGKPVKREQS